MSLLIVLCFCYLSSLTPTDTHGCSLDCVPRKTVPYSNNGRLFREEGIWNYSTMLLREDLNVLILGAREAVFALDLKDITQKLAEVKWEVPDKQQDECGYKGKDIEVDCQNYIRILHKMEDGKMYVCGTHAFNPTCDHLTYANGTLTREGIAEDGKGKCPFDPFQRYASAFVEGHLFSATSMNFLGSEPVVMRSSEDQIRTEFTTSWLNEPTFIYMDHIAEGGVDDDDDKVYLFFSETAVEYDFFNRLAVSRVARVCKGDQGGLRTLQRKWTSFMKARLDCPVLKASLPFLVQDVFRLCDGHWSSCLFYAVFTSQLESSQHSAVCAYSIKDIQDVFTKGKFKTKVSVQPSFEKWVMYNGDLPDPRPGACINPEARDKGYKTSLDLPDKTLQFIKDRPLMDQAVQPLRNGPVLIKNGAAFTRIVVTNVTALDRNWHIVMFIGTESGSVLKAVNYEGEMFIIEEVQVFQPAEPVNILRLSVTTGQLYVGSNLGAMQMPLSVCSRYSSCVDCVLARDPYCVWDLTINKCANLFDKHRNGSSEIIQSLMKGDASRCPPAESAKPVKTLFFLGSDVKLHCPPGSNLARTEWKVNEEVLTNSKSRQIHHDGLMILNASDTDAGHYVCRSVEKTYYLTHAMYDLSVQGSASRHLPQNQRNSGELVTLKVFVALLSMMLVALVVWNLYQGHISLPGCSKVRQDTGSGQTAFPSVLDPLCNQEEKVTALPGNSNSNNNHEVDDLVLSYPEEKTINHSPLDIRYIDDESEI
ncbi:semaphorin-4E [Chanos chanos]|uniref:Semaphorin-4E n=1 Tax=Chanos chanos TaxID=29144 RepID=A0A6J2VCF9_CHACN|nr:semaphorin-4E-like [Chanos chanos]